MIFQEKLGFIFYRKNLKLSLHLRTSKLGLKMRLEKPLRPFVQIVVVNITKKNLKYFEWSIAFAKRLKLPIHHSKMVYQRGKT